LLSSTRGEFLEARFAVFLAADGFLVWVMFEILHRAFVFDSGGACLEGSKIAALACLRIDFTRRQTITAFLFADHFDLPRLATRLAPE
jgi:hypothetical protein